MHSSGIPPEAAGVVTVLSVQGSFDSYSRLSQFFFLTAVCSLKFGENLLWGESHCVQCPR